MPKPSLGPNIPFFCIAFPGGDYVIHNDGCKGLIIQPAKRGNRHVLVPRGKAYCEKCRKIVGRKATRCIETRIRDGILHVEGYQESNNHEQHRIFLQLDVPPQPSLREVVEITVPRKLAKRLKNLGDHVINDMLREAAEGIIGKKGIARKKSDAALLSAVQFLAKEDYGDEDEDVEF